MITFNDIINNKVEMINYFSLAYKWMIGIILFIFVFSIYQSLKKKKYFSFFASIIISLSLILSNYIFIIPLKQDALAKIAYISIIKNQCTIDSVNRQSSHVNLKGIPFFGNQNVSINVNCSGKKQKVDL